QDGRVGTNPNVILDAHRLARNRGAWFAFTQRRARNGIGDTFSGRDGMKIRIRHSRIPADNDVIAEDNLQLTKQHRIGEVAVIADAHARISTESEMDTVHCRMPADDKRVRS